MLEWLWFPLAALASYRIAHDFVNTEGPFELYEKLRDEWSNDDWIGRGVRCFVCVSFWTSLLFAVIVMLLGLIDLGHLILVWPGLAGAALVIDRYWKR